MILFVREKSIYFDVNKKSTKTKIKKWIEGFFGVKIIKMNSH
jgi:ribosomal protein L23